MSCVHAYYRLEEEWHSLYPLSLNIAPDSPAPLRNDQQPSAIRDCRD